MPGSPGWRISISVGGGKYKLNGASIAGTENDAIYQSERYGAMSYNLPVSNGTYNVELHFAEIYFTDADVGSRVFDVTVEGQLALDDFDILSKTSAGTAWVETISDVVVDDGVLTIAFGKVVGNPKISAIALYSSSGDGGNQSPSVATARSSFSKKLDYTNTQLLNDPENESKFVVYPIPYKNQVTIQLNDKMSPGVEVQLYTTSGTQIFIPQNDITYEGNKITMSLSGFEYQGDMLILVVRDKLNRWYGIQKLLRKN